MTNRNSLAMFSLSVAVGLLLAVLVRASETPPDKPVEVGREIADAQPGTRCVITADLECEIHEVTENGVLIKIAAVREAERGVPMVHKIPYIDRCFKNVGVVSDEADVVLRIPNDRIEGIVPLRDAACPTHAHLQQAIEHLQAAGLNELVEHVHEHIRQKTRQARLTAKRNEIEALQQRIARLRAELDAFGECPPEETPVGQRQILVELQVLEVSRKKLREIGFDFESGFGGALRSGLEAHQQQQKCAAFTTLDQDAEFLKIIESLRHAGIVKVLAEPTLVTVSGRPASFHSGGEFPVLIPQGDGLVAVEYREFGTRVDLLPIYLGNEKLRLEVRPVISELDPSRSVTVGDVKIPGLRVRTVDTAVELMLGQTFVVGGMIQGTLGANDDGAEQASDETELLVLVKPSLVEGISHAPVPTSAKRPSKPAQQGYATPTRDRY